MRVPGQPIVALGTNPWDAYWQTRQHIMAGLAVRGFDVAYFTGALYVWEILGRRWWRASRRDCAVAVDGVRVCQPDRWRLRWPRFPRWDRGVLRHHATALRALVGSSQRAPIVYVFHPGFLPYLEWFDECRVVYHADDNFALMPNAPPEIGELQTAMMARADLVIASSARTAAALAPIRPVRVLPNGADAEAFRCVSGCPCPGDLARIPAPRLGYVGFLNDKVNYAIMAAIAQIRPSWHWVLVGPRVAAKHLSEESREGLARCEAAANVHLLGGRPYRDLPRYVQHMDVNTMCYRTTPGGWWTDIYPLKLHEYLASGKPTVGANIDSIREFSEVVAIAESVEQWVDAIECALERGGVGDPARRLAVARENSWDHRLELLGRWLAELG